MQTKEIKTALLEYSENKILKIAFKSKTNIDIKEAEEIYVASKEITNDEVHVNFIDAREMTYISNEARNFLAQKNESHVLAISVLVKSVIQERIANFYMKFNKPKIQTKIFTTQDAALKWLNTQVIKHRLNI